MAPAPGALTVCTELEALYRAGAVSAADDSRAFEIGQITPRHTICGAVERVTIKPSNRIRRFDVFAEYRKQEEQAGGMPADEAKGYGLWVAKVVAARKFGRLKDRERPSEAEGRARRRRKWRVLSGERQTDRLFDHQIVDRMGPDFYNEVFAPAIRHERAVGHSYESIRDRIRRRWKPAPH